MSQLMKVVSAKVIATCFALCAFAVAILSGLSSANPTAQILQRAILAMFVCYPVGLAVGLICERVIASHVGAVSGSPNVRAAVAGNESAPAIQDKEKEVLVV
jgi:hypothetical protein